VPLVRFIGGASPSDNTEYIRLNPDDEGRERLLVRGNPDFMEISGDELRQISSHYEVEVESEGSDEADELDKTDGSDESDELDRGQTAIISPPSVLGSPSSSQPSAPTQPSD
jgi:hypothetical protein